MSQSKHGGPRQPSVQVVWTTVTYRTVILAILAGLGLCLLFWWLIHPDSFNRVSKAVIGKLSSATEAPPQPLSNRARFVNLDGKVLVRKVASVNFVPADQGMTLDKGDLIQTGSDGLARIAFANGTTYTVKSDTLITVEANAVGENQGQGRSVVHIRSGAVDLTTAGSQAGVQFENAEALIRENSRAAVRTDPESQQHEVTVSSGSGELVRGGERIQLGQYEKVRFQTGGEATKSNVLAPPELTKPINFSPIVVDDPKHYAMQFEWKPVSGAVLYHIRVSHSSMFTQLLAERRVNTASASVSGLDAGDYFWAVTAIDAQKGSSELSEVYKFTLAVQGKGQEMLLEVEGIQFHGNVVEVVGRTEPGATVIINGQAVSRIQQDGRFQYFTPPMARGSQTIAISAQNRRGGVANKKLPIVIP